MAKYTMKASGAEKFGAPVGIYQARFAGTQERESEQYGPGLEWQFEIVEGVYKGKIVSRTTSREPTLKNSCGKILNQMAGGTVEAEQEVDLAQFRDRVYQIMVEANSTGNGTRIGAVMPLSFSGGPIPELPPDPRTTGAPQHTSANIKTPPTRKGPPPGLGTATAAAPAFVEQPTDPFELEYNGDVYEMTRAEVATWVNIQAGDPTGYRLKCLVGPTSGQWHTVGSHGFKWTAPF